MPFLTQGKTNWKYILIIVILAVIVAGGIFAWQYFGAPKEVRIPEEKVEISNKTIEKEAKERKILGTYPEDAPCQIDSWSPNDKYLVIDCGTTPSRTKDVYDVSTEKKVISFSTYGGVQPWFWLSEEEIIFREPHPTPVGRPWETGDAPGISRINLATGKKKILKQPTDLKQYGDLEFKVLEDGNILFSLTEVSSPDKWDIPEEKSTTYWIMNKDGEIIKQIFKE